ncbi:hypothetical protein [Paenibacillus xylaniclasticus]|uniref:hypothetical protein n=1 Tax=Paenibacillus xylaniclasticus TaxID=588083 RepID=UPI000FDAA44B|nr:MULTISPECIES: hypothetical protein [Paenibacillus]GFN32168.1 hypothetical protein PCURB6_24280 [Paenibacillus curdlanolyticus]
MIQINPQLLAQVAPYYWNEMKAGLKLRYAAASGSGAPVQVFTIHRATELFENGGGQLDEAFVEQLIAGDLHHLISRNPIIENYWKTGLLVHYSSFQVNRELERLGRPRNRLHQQQYRVEFVDRFRNPWVEPYIQQYRDYAQSNEKFKAFITGVSQALDQLNESIKAIVSYERDLPDELRHELLHRMGTDVCPYCNRQFITYYWKNKKQRYHTTADLDHFYPKSQFPLFSLSLYNFVPSCQICNSRFKLDKGVELLYPYEEGFEADAYFKVNYNSGSTIGSILGDNTSFNIEIVLTASGSKRERIQNNIETFELTSVYQSHKDYARELLYKRKKYADLLKADLKKLFEDAGTGLTLTDREIALFQYGFSMEPEEFSRRPLSKFAYDIVHRN